MNKQIIPLDESDNGLHVEIEEADNDGFHLCETNTGNKIYVYFKESKDVAKLIMGATAPDLFILNRENVTPEGLMEIGKQIGAIKQ